MEEIYHWPHIECITETWLAPSSMFELNQIEDYSTFVVTDVPKKEAV